MGQLGEPDKVSTLLITSWPISFLFPLANLSFNWTYFNLLNQFSLVFLFRSCLLLFLLLPLFSNSNFRDNIPHFPAIPNELDFPQNLLPLTILENIFSRHRSPGALSDISWPRSLAVRAWAATSSSGCGPASIRPSNVWWSARDSPHKRRTRYHDPTNSEFRCFENNTKEIHNEVIGIIKMSHFRVIMHFTPKLDNNGGTRKESFGVTIPSWRNTYNKNNEMSADEWYKNWWRYEIKTE